MWSIARAATCAAHAGEDGVDAAVAQTQADDGHPHSAGFFFCTILP
jgi:hypothetical protein